MSHFLPRTFCPAGSGGRNPWIIVNLFVAASNQHTTMQVCAVGQFLTSLILLSNIATLLEVVTMQRRYFATLLHFYIATISHQSPVLLSSIATAIILS